ncbi:MAG: CRISPR-associated endonuclease Cas1 [Rhodovarius sp.]|nr:CRISPR-associated endonuclease Cas1 [Rhodovarius sp.]
MLEALHLDGADQPVAVLLEGPALRLRRSGIADVFAPLPRLSRVVVHGPRVQWRTEALLACAEAGVQVVLLDGRGVLRGTLVPASAPAQRRELAALLEEKATLPGFRGRLEDFCRAELRRAALQALRAEGIGPEGLDLRLRPLLERWLGPRREEAPTWAAWALLRGLGAAAVAEALSRRGVGPQFLARRSGCFPLPEQLGEALVLPLCPALSPLLAQAGCRMRRAVIALFEGSTPVAELERMLARLAVCLAAEV